MKIKGEITRVEDLISILDNDEILKLHHLHLRLWFRGHGSINWELKPKLYRGDFKPLDEVDRRRFESHFDQDFKTIGASDLRGDETQAEIYFLQQHHGIRTRLLDWSSNPLVALWFAVEDDKNEDDGAVYFMDAYQFKGLPFGFGIATPHHGWFKKSLKAIHEFKKDGGFPKRTFPIRPEHKVQRIRHQQSYLTLHVPDEIELTQAQNHTLVRYRVPFKYKSHIRKALKLLSIDSYFVYGGLDNLAKELEESYIGRWNAMKKI